MSLISTNVNVNVRSGESKAAAYQTSSFPVLFSASLNYTDGTGARAAQKCVPVNISLTNGAFVNIDLTALSGIYGTVTLTKLKLFGALSLGQYPGDVLEVGDNGSTANPFTAFFNGTNARLKLDPGEIAIRSTPSLAGWAVDGTHKNLRVANTSTNTVTAELLFIGEGS